MRLKAAVGGAIWIWATTALCSAHAFGNDVAGALVLRRYGGMQHDLLKRDSVSIPTPTPTKSKADVFGAAVWPTVSIPVGFTLAAGVMITPLPVVAMSSISGTAAMSSAISAATEIADPATWNQEVESACQTAMSNLAGVADNESGMVACYNIAYLDTSKGLFEADLRIFNVSTATGSFVGVTEAEMMVTLSYGTAQLTSNSTGTMAFPVKKRNVVLHKRQAAATGSTATGVLIPNEVMSQKYLVQLNASSFTPGMNE
jgi:hypothetical protein